jgi:hypothetical protein
MAPHANRTRKAIKNLHLLRSFVLSISIYSRTLLASAVSDLHNHRMRIGIFTALFGDKTLVETLDLVQAEGIEAVELGAGAYPGSAHLEVETLLQSQAAREDLLEQVAKRGLHISPTSTTKRLSTRSSWRVCSG